MVGPPFDDRPPIPSVGSQSTGSRCRVTFSGGTKPASFRRPSSDDGDDRISAIIDGQRTSIPFRSDRVRTTLTSAFQLKLAAELVVRLATIVFARHGGDPRMMIAPARSRPEHLFRSIPASITTATLCFKESSRRITARDPLSRTACRNRRHDVSARSFERSWTSRSESRRRIHLSVDPRRAALALLPCLRSPFPHGMSFRSPPKAILVFRLGRKLPPPPCGEGFGFRRLSP